MPIYTVRNSQTGQAYDLPLERDINSYTEAQLDQMVAQQDAQRQAEVQASRAAAASAAALPRGSTERAEAMAYQPLEIPGIGETTMRELGSALSRIAPDVARSALMVNAGLTPQAIGRYMGDSVARAASGQAPENPIDAGSRYMAGARNTPVYQGLEGIAKYMRDFYDYDRANVPEEQQALSQAVGGGAGSALGYAATIPTGGVGLLPLALGQTIAPTAEEYLDRGVDPSKAIPQALIAGGIEAGSELVLGLPGKIARRLGLAPQMAQALRPIADKVDSVIKSWVGEVGLGMGQEGLEEMISGIATDLSAVYLTGADPGALDNFLDKRIQEFVGGAIGGAVVGPAARQARQIQERTRTAQANVDRLRKELSDILGQRAEASRQAELQRQGQPPVLPGEESLPITGIAQAIARANNPGVPLPLNVQPNQPRPQDLPYDLLTQLNAERLPLNVPPQQPTPQDLPYDLLTQLNAERLPANVQPVQPSPQDLPYDLLTQLAAERLPLNVPPNQPRPQDLPYDLLTQINPQAQQPAAAQPAPSRRASAQQLKGASGPSIADLEARSVKPKGGAAREEEGMQEEVGQPAGTVLPAVPPLPSDPPPSQIELDEAAKVMAEPPYPSGLGEAKNVNEHIRIFRKRIKEIEKEKSKVRREKLLSDLLDEHRASRDKFVQGKKLKALADLEAEGAISLGDPSQSWALLEVAIDSDLAARQQDWLTQNINRIPDVPGVDATPADVEEYERQARMPQHELAFTSPSEGSVAPWESPTKWKTDYLKTSKRPGDKPQRTNRHVFVELDGKVYLMPVYLDAKSTLSAGQQVKIGDPRLFFSANPKFRITANEFATKYLGKAKYLGTVRLPVGAAREWMTKVEWTPEEAQQTMVRLGELQSDAIQQGLYPADAAAASVPSTTEEGGEIDASFMQQLAIQEPAMAHILDFVDAFTSDYPPIYAGEKEVRRWVIRKFEEFIRTDSTARDTMNQVVAIAMRSAIVRDTKSGAQTVAGMPLHIAKNPEYAKRWFKDKLARAFIADLQTQLGAIQEVFGPPTAQPATGLVRGALVRGTREGVAGELARRIAPGIAVTDQELRSRGLRTSDPGDYAKTIKRLKGSDRSEAEGKRGRVLSRLRARGEVQPTTGPRTIPSRIKSDQRAIAEQVKQSKKPVKAQKVQSTEPAGAPTARWQKLKDKDGFDYWVAPWSAEMETWMGASPQNRKAVDAVRIRGAGSYFQTYVNPSKFSQPTATPSGEMAYQEAAAAARQADARRSKKKPSDLRLSAARPIPENPGEFSAEFERDFSRVGGDVIRLDSNSDGPIAVEITSDGRIVLVMNSAELRKLGPEEWTAIWDEELRHVALLSFARSRLRDTKFVGDVGARVRQDLAEAWAAINPAERQEIERNLRKIYGRPLDDAQKTAELVRMIGQGQFTESVTRRSLGQRFLDLVRDFAQWLKSTFTGKMPQPIKELVDGAEMVLRLSEGGTPVPTLISEDGLPAELRLDAAEVSAQIDRQRLTTKEVIRRLTSGNLGALGQRRLAEMEAVQSSMLDTPSRDLVKALDDQATTAITPGLPAWDRRRQQDEKRAAGIAWGRLKSLRELAELTNWLPPGTTAAGQQAMMGAAPKLTEDQKMEVMHDAIGVVAVHERLDADINRLEDQLILALRKESSDLKRLIDFMGSNPDPASMKALIKGRMDNLRQDVARAFELSNIATEKQLSHALHENIPMAGERAALHAALSALGSRQGAEDMKFLLERLANHPRLQDLTLWPVDEDSFYNQLVITGVMQDAIAGGPGLSVSKTVAIANTAPAVGVRPPLQAWGQLRSTLESLQGYKEEHALALAELTQLAPIVDPLANISRDKAVSYRRSLLRYQRESAKVGVILDRLSRYDNRLRQSGIARRGLERAIDTISQVMQSQQYRTMVGNAVTITHRRADQVIFDTKAAKDKALGTITLLMPPPTDPTADRKALDFKLSFEMAETDAERARLAAAADEIETWLTVNHAGDPIMVETYRAALIRLRHFLNPNYAISEGTINESGLFGLLNAPMRMPWFRDYLHPVLKEIDDNAKGMTKGLMTRAIAPFVRFGLFEQGLKPDMVKIKAAKRDGMASHDLVTRFRARDILDPFRMDRVDDDYRWLVIEPILRSWQNSSQFHLEAGNTLPDYAGQISPTGSITITPQDIKAAQAQVEYERKLRNFTTTENFGFGEGQVTELNVVEQSAGGQTRTRLPFAAGPGVMSRSFSHKANGTAMSDFRRARIQIADTVGADNNVHMVEAGMDKLRAIYLDQVLRGRANAGVTDGATWVDVIMAHVLETNPEYAMRAGSPLVRVYDSIAQDTYKNGLQITRWSDLITTIADRMATVLGDKRPYAVRLNEAELQLAKELTEGMENIRVILDNQTSAQNADVHVLAPKSSFTTARGSIIGAPGLYEYGLHSDFAINALHGTVLRHVSNNVIQAMGTMSAALERYIADNDTPRGAANIAGRKRRAEAAYNLTEAIRLNKAIKDQLQVMKAFEEATRDPEQYYHDIMRWSSMLLVRPLVSAATNPLSVIKDTLLTVSVGATRQRRSLWENVNWWFTTPKAVKHWLEAASTVVLASFATTPGNRRRIKQAIVSMVPGMASAVHNASQRISQARLDLGIRGISLADESILMSTSGSLMGIQGALEWEKTRPLVSKVIKIMDRVVQRVPGSKTATFLIGESRTIAEDINAMMFSSIGRDDLRELTRRAMEALATRERQGTLVTDPASTMYPLNEKELGMSFGGLRQARRWLEGSSGLEATMLAHYLANRGKSIQQMVEAELPKGALQAWNDNYITESQVQTLRERPAVAYRKGLTGRVARMFTSLKTWASNAYYSYIQGEILRTKVTRPFYTRMPDEIARMVAMLILLMVLGAPSVAAIDWLKDKMGRPQGLTVENLIENPNLQSFLTLAVGVGTQVIPLSSMIEEGLSGWGQGSIDLFRMAPVLSGAQGFYRALATIARTSNWNDPKSVADAAEYQFKGLATRMLGILGMARGASDEGYRQYVEASQSIRKLAPSDVDRSPRTQGKIPTSPAYDNVRRAVQMKADALRLANEGKTEEAEAMNAEATAEVQEGLRQVIESGVEPDAARKKIQAALSAQSGFRGGFERSLTEEEKAETLEKATPKQRASILNREAAVRQLSGLMGKGRSSFATVGSGGGGRPVAVKVNRSGSKLAARLRSRRTRAATSPTRSFLRPIQIRTRKRRSTGFARLARLRRKLGLPA